VRRLKRKGAHWRRTHRPFVSLPLILTHTKEPRSINMHTHFHLMRKLTSLHRDRDDGGPGCDAGGQRGPAAASGAHAAGHGAVCESLHPLTYPTVTTTTATAAPHTGLHSLTCIPPPPPSPQRPTLAFLYGAQADPTVVAGRTIRAGTGTRTHLCWLPSWMHWGPRLCRASRSSLLRGRPPVPPSARPCSKSNGVGCVPTRQDARALTG
jgi:hypothetical protein